MSRAFVFPGQGAQTIGMGQALAGAYPAAKAVFDEVDDALVSIRRASEQLEDVLADTRVVTDRVARGEGTLGRLTADETLIDEVEGVAEGLNGIVGGIGFLGAGAIMVRSAQHQIEGLTTAANIWATAGIGVMAGLGLEATAVLSAFVVLIILAAVPVILPKAAVPDARNDER